MCFSRRSALPSVGKIKVRTFPRMAKPTYGWNTIQTVFQNGQLNLNSQISQPCRAATVRAC